MTNYNIKVSQNQQSTPTVTIGSVYELTLIPRIDSIENQLNDLLNGNISEISLTPSLLTLISEVGNLTANIPIWNQNTTGSAATLSTPRLLTIGNTGKEFDGSGNINWSLEEIGVQPLLTNPVTGIGVTGQIAFFNGSNGIIGDSSFVWNNTLKRLSLIDGTAFTATSEAIFNIVANSNNLVQDNLRASIAVLNTNPSTGSTSTIRLGYNSSNIGAVRGSEIRSVAVRAAANGRNRNFEFWTDDESVLKRIGVWDYLGRLGIGNITPTQTIDTIGNIRVRSLTTNQGDFVQSDSNGVFNKRTTEQVNNQLLTNISGYNATVTQSLKHDSTGNFIWVND